MLLSIFETILKQSETTLAAMKNIKTMKLYPEAKRIFRELDNLGVKEMVISAWFLPLHFLQNFESDLESTSKVSVVVDEFLTFSKISVTSSMNMKSLNLFTLPVILTFLNL